MFIKITEKDGCTHLINIKYITSINDEKVYIWKDQYLDIDKREYDYIISKLLEADILIGGK